MCSCLKLFWRVCCVRARAADIGAIAIYIFYILYMARQKIIPIRIMVMVREKMRFRIDCCCCTPNIRYKIVIINGIRFIFDNSRAPNVISHSYIYA